MPTDVVAALEKDQAEIAALFEDVSRPDADRPKVLQEIVRRVAAHVAVERSLVVPVVRRKVQSGRNLAKTLSRQCRRLEDILVKVEHRKAGSPDMPELVSDLLEVFERHTATSRDSLFPALRRSLDGKELEDLGRQVEEREETVLSHPHPHLLSLGPVNRILLPIAGLVDRLRDRTLSNP